MENNDAARIDFDLADASHFAQGHPYALYAQLREHAPIHYVAPREGRPGYWLISRYEDVLKIAQSHGDFINAQGFRIFESAGMINLKPHVRQAVLSHFLTLDQPDHTELRAQFQPHFSPGAFKKMSDRIEAYVDQLIATLQGQSEVEFVEAFASRVPIFSLCQLLGIDDTDREKIFKWTNQLVGTADPEYGPSPDVSAAAFEEVFEYGRTHVAKRLAQGGEDVIAQMAHAHLRGAPLDEHFRNGMFTVLLAAGNETTRNSLSGAIVALTQFPDQKQKLRDHPELIDQAVDELLRYITPVIHMARTARADVQLQGVEIKAGDKLALLFGAANRDPEIFEQPDQLIIDRSNARRHLSFGNGIHHCLGFHMARLQLRIMLRKLLATFPNIEAAATPIYMKSNFVSAIKRLPVRLQ